MVIWIYYTSLLLHLPIKMKIGAYLGWQTLGREVYLHCKQTYALGVYLMNGLLWPICPPQIAIHSPFQQWVI